jgi:hypothetical protein
MGKGRGTREFMGDIGIGVDEIVECVESVAYRCGQCRLHGPLAFWVYRLQVPNKSCGLHSWQDERLPLRRIVGLCPIIVDIS